MPNIPLSAGPGPIAEDLHRQLRLLFASDIRRATPEELFRATATILRDPITAAMAETRGRFEKADAKALNYLSMEFLLGRSLANNLHNLGMYRAVEDALADSGLRLCDVLEAEPDAALGNGGLGRLAACFLDSLATLHLRGYGYGINYEFGLFRQEIKNGRQVERPDSWSRGQSPWLIEQPGHACLIPVYGRVEHATDRDGRYNPMWLDWKLLIGLPWDFPIVGQDGRTVNYVRLFAACSSDEFDIGIFNEGDYLRAVEQKIQSEAVSKVLYPSDAVASGLELRLIQEYFLVACAVRDILRRFLSRHADVRELPRHAAIQLNDTHPALTVAELMRTLVDEHSLDWEEAWDVTRQVCAYTNHTLMPEALERWPVEAMERVLPRHLQIVYEINRRLLDDVARRWPGDTGRLQRMSLIQERPARQVRMANLAIAGSHAVNGVARIHSELVCSDLVPDFHQFFPGAFSNKTNGVTPRRWLMHINPGLCGWIDARIGPAWRTDLDRLEELAPFAGDESSREEFSAVKRANKMRLAGLVRNLTGVSADPAAIFDVQVKRIHEYKRQLLNALGIVDEYLSELENPGSLAAPRVHIFAGKAAPGYFMAKLIIKLINNIADTVNADKRLGGRLRVAFLPDYRVSLAEVIIPGADLSEQISTAGTEASGTSNMKFALNGALTIGTLDGANVEIREAVGEENFFLFGLTTPEVRRMRESGYSAREWYRRDDRIRRTVDAIASDRFSPGERGIFAPIVRNLLDVDYYLHFVDFRSYIAAQDQVARTYTDPAEWNAKAIRNVARMARFSSDRTIREYADEIWNIAPVPPE